jgi:hypothetical protein
MDLSPSPIPINRKFIDNLWSDDDDDDDYDNSNNSIDNNNSDDSSFEWNEEDENYNNNNLNLNNNKNNTLLKSNKIIKKKTNHNNISNDWLKKRKLKEKIEKISMDAIVFQEARIFQTTAITCINEANLFAELLNKPIRYSMVKRNKNEDEYWDNITNCNEKKFALKSLPIGTGKRISKMMIHAIVIDSNGNVKKGDSNKRILSIEHFFSEHKMLQNELNKMTSCLPSTHIYSKNNNNKIKNNNNNNNNNLLKSTTSLKLDESIIYPWKHASSSFYDDANIDNNNNQFDYKEFENNNNKYIDSTRKGKEEHLKKILQDNVICTKTIDLQLNEIIRRGWNL